MTLAVALGGAAPVYCRDWVPAAHVGIAEANGGLHRMIGVSIGTLLPSDHEFRFRVDTTVGKASSQDSGRTDSRLTSLAADWLWHKGGGSRTGLLLGAGLSVDAYQWVSVTGAPPVRKDADDVKVFPHFNIGWAFSQRFRIEARVRVNITNNGDANTNASDSLVFLNAGWRF
jgi:hypothetical protein